MANEISLFKAEKYWRDIPKHIQTKILNCVWCSNCLEGQKIKDWKFELRGKEERILIVGKCSVCDGDCVRSLED